MHYRWNAGEGGPVRVLTFILSPSIHPRCPRTPQEGDVGTTIVPAQRNIEPHEGSALLHLVDGYEGIIVWCRQNPSLPLPCLSSCPAANFLIRFPLHFAFFLSLSGAFCRRLRLFVVGHWSFFVQYFLKGWSILIYKAVLALQWIETVKTRA